MVYRICAYCAVNIFALISGYVSYTDKEKKTNYSNYINTWLQVVFYGILVTIIFNIINPLTFSKGNYIKVLLPVTNDLYWYFTAYTALFAIMPLLNKGIRSCSNQTMKKVFIVIFIVFSIFDTIAKKFVLNNGYSAVWIILLYILGATMKKCEIGKKLKGYQIALGILILYVITYLYKIYGLEITKLNVTITKDLFICYTSPTMLGIAILYVIGLSRVNFNNICKKIIKFIAPSAFTIYLLNEHELIRKYIIDNLFVDLANQSLVKIFIYVIGFSFIFAIISILVDKIRILLFKIFKVKNLSNKISDILGKIMDKIITL